MTSPYRIPIQVLVNPAARTPDGRRYLLLRRVPSAGGFWQGVSGAPWQGESLEEAARRELGEETGLVPEWMQPVDYTYTFPLGAGWTASFAPGTEILTEHCFVAEVPLRDPVLGDEHDTFRWCSFDEALGLLHWPENVDALRRCEAILAARNVTGHHGLLHHVEIYVEDLPRSERFWSWFLGELGYQEHQRWEKGVSYRLGATYLVFVQVEAPFRDAGYQRCRAGLNHLAFHAASPGAVDAMRSGLLARGVRLLYDDRSPHAGGPTSYAVFFEDPMGMKVEYVSEV